MCGFRSVWWCAFVAVSMGLVSRPAAAQFGPGRQEQQIREAERRLAAAYDAAAPNSNTGSVPTVPCQCLDESDSSSAARIKQVLDQPLKSGGLDFVEQPLADVTAFLQDEYSIPIYIDLSALEDSGLTPEEQITISVRNVSLQSALRMMLRKLQLTLLIQNEVLVITTPEVVEENLVTCVYDVRDLVNDGRSFRLLADAITSCVAYETWATHGGGEAEIRPVNPGLLVIAQTAPVHDEVRDLLAAIRTMRFRRSVETYDSREMEAPDEAQGRIGSEGEMGGEMGVEPARKDSPHSEDHIGP